jgi:hypothetical protein
MRFDPFTTVALLFVPTVCAQATLQKFKGEKKPGSYIVKFKKGTDRTSLINELGGNRYVSHKYSKTTFNGFAGKEFMVLGSEYIH